jgi:hypothetical protein
LCWKFFSALRACQRARNPANFSATVVIAEPQSYSYLSNSTPPAMSSEANIFLDENEIYLPDRQKL